MTAAPAPPSEAAPLEYVAASDRFADFCLWDYDPCVPPVGRFRSSTLLWQIMAMAGCSARFGAALRALRQGLGPFQTVWCAKEFDGAISFEFYFYDYRRDDRAVSVERVLAILAPFVPCSLRVLPAKPYFMFSLDIDDRVLHETKEIDHLNIYIGNPGSTVSSGICYNVSNAGQRLDNFYFFFQAKSEYDDILSKLYCSMHLGDRRVPVEALLWPEASVAEVIVVANKRASDGVYYSRTGIDGFLAFLARTRFPPAFLRFATQNRDALSHMLYDVGIDYTTQDGTVGVLKTAFYGLL